MQMQAAILTEPHTPFRIESVALDPPKAGELRVKLAASGICRSDWRVAIGTAPKPMPIVTGHEGAGIVEAVGAGVTRAQVGDHVTLTWAPICGECFYCQRGKANLCAAYRPAIATGLLDDGTARVHWRGEPVYILAGLGSFAEYAVVREASCVPIRRDVPLDVAALVGCAVATGVGAAMYTGRVGAGASVAVFGAGGIGLNIIHGAQLCGAHPIIAVDANEAKSARARQFGATHTLSSAEKTVDQIQALTGGRGVDHAFEAVGIPKLQERAFAATRPGGTLTLVGTAPDGSTTNLPGAVITRSEKIVRGCSYGSVNPQRDIPLLLDLYRAGKLKLEQLITRRYRLDQINHAYTDLLSGELARGIIVF
ncbi:MAG: Zn-dependent alcohol dehydrogenase [Chloroflexi bacterium]|nr:Zn-dependent alcohol dehydrogenase [Chloroflexota bacterium]